jgi:uncharacterized membrane protein YedE/YeeE
MPKSMPRKFLSPLAAGLGLGATLYLSFLLTGHGLGAFGFFRDLTASLAAWVKPFWAAENPYLLTFLYEDGPLSTWIAWEVAGIGVGGLAGSLAARRFRFKIERGPGISSGARLVFALLGGLLTGLGAALARGCTSGLGLSGGAVLSAGAYVFLIAFFVAGVSASVFSKRLWR